MSCASTGICTWHTALVQLARCRPCVPTAAGAASASLDSRLAGRCRPTDGSEQVDDRSRSANLSTILAGCRGTARVRAVHTALPAWLILLRGLTDACLPPARALAAKMGMLRWVCYGPEPRSASLGLPFDCTFSSTLSLGHPAMCLLLTARGSVMLLTAQGSLTAAAGVGRPGSAVVLFL